MLISVLPVRYYIISKYISTYWVTGVDISTSSEVLHLSLHILVLSGLLVLISVLPSSELLHLSLHILVLTGLLVLISVLPLRYYIYLYIYLFLLDYCC